MAGYVEALLICIQIGFLIGLFPFFRGSFAGPATRYVPLTVSWPFYRLVRNWYSNENTLSRLWYSDLSAPDYRAADYEVNNVYLKTVYTLGATDWQTIKTVYFPSVMSRLSDDVRVLTARFPGHTLLLLKISEARVVSVH